MAENLDAKVQFLEHQLRSQRIDLQLFRFGGGGFLVAVGSLLLWVFTGIGVPFHPVFAALAVPASVGTMVMAFLIHHGVAQETQTTKPELEYIKLSERETIVIIHRPGKEDLQVVVELVPPRG